MPLRMKTRCVSKKVMTLDDSEGVAGALDDFATRRNEFLRCSGMHTKPVQNVLEVICQGKVRGPGVGFVAPALYEGIPEFLDKTMDVMGELAVYASLYMGLIATIGVSGYFPSPTFLDGFYNGVYGSMFCHSAVVLMAVTYRLAAVGHLRDSDKLLYLWRARYVPLLSYILFSIATVSVLVALNVSTAEMVEKGGACFVGIGDPTMSWWDWCWEWVDTDRIPVGAGVVHPKGEQVLNPWILRANELGIAAPGGKSQKHRDQYSEFIRDHFGFSKSCEPQQALHERYGGYLHDNVRQSHMWLYPYLIICLILPWVWCFVWIAPTRHIFNYWLQPQDKCKRHSLGFLAYEKIDDPYDLTEAWAEFQYRAMIGAKLAGKDVDHSGFVDIMEHRQALEAELDTGPENQKNGQAGSTPTAGVQQLIATQQKTNELLEKLIRMNHGETPLGDIFSG